MPLRTRIGLLLALLLPPVALRAQTPQYSPVQIERLAKLSELYGHIKFFHPYLGYKKINWDSAYAANAPLVAQASTEAETAEALRRLLAVLGDGASRVELLPPGAASAAPVPPTPPAADSVRVFFAADSTLVLQTNTYAGDAYYSAAQKRLSYFVAQLPKARAVLLDLRGQRPLTADEAKSVGYLFRYAGPSSTGLERFLTPQPLAAITSRMRQHSGFVPEAGSSSGGYWSGFYSIAGQPTAPLPGVRSRPLGILANKNTVLSEGLYALRTQPQVRFFSAEPLADDRLAPTVTFPFSETIGVTFRTGELLNADGSLGLTGIVPLPATIRPDAAEAYVLAQLHAPRPAAALATGSTPGVPAPTVAPTYPAGSYPALGYRLLAGAKIWSVIHYFFAYKELMPGDWNADLRTALGELAAAPDSTGYALVVARFYRHIQDGHGVITASPLRAYVGTGGLPAEVRFIEGKPVISRVYADSLAAGGVRVGDVITAVNGEPIAARIARLSAIRAASNEWTRRRYVAAQLLRGPVGSPLRVTLVGADNRAKTLTFPTLPDARLAPPPDTTATYRVLPGGLGYANLSRLKQEQVTPMFEAFKNTKGIVFDMRGYPLGTAWVIAPRLTSRPNVLATSFFRYTPNRPDIPKNGEATPPKNISSTRCFPPATLAGPPIAAKP